MLLSNLNISVILKVDRFHLQGQQVAKRVTTFTALQSRIRASFSY